ncbi:MAG: Uncharacterised protein [Candidatus Poseidoniaceae archaeon]|nr:MAG: Uncharacterised protein [Candidatus Poseidoniaceae archaeon]
MIPAIPAAAFKWPIWDLIEPTAMLSPDATSVQSRVSVDNSVASPTFVEVPCASTNSTEDAG